MTDQTPPSPASPAQAEDRATQTAGLDQPVIELPERGTREDFARVSKYWRDRAIAAEAALRAPAEAATEQRLREALEAATDYIEVLEHAQDGYYRADTSYEAKAWEQARAALSAPKGED